MKKIISGIVLLVVLATIVFLIAKINLNKKQTLSNNNSITSPKVMKIQSSAFEGGQNIPIKYSCDGDGVNPPLQFSEIPEKAQTLALTMVDPDAPNGLWVHWLLWNIPTTTTEVFENSFPQGSIQGQGSNGQKVYSGPCPPNFTHHYVFTLYALDAKIEIPSYSSLADLTHAMQDHILQTAQLTGLYSHEPTLSK